ncbi:MAG: 3'-5' exonuclease [Acidobacteriota bacterium]|nr:3'-5' exonuclease [Acidobacteriota bacterium]MDH3524118.1 3'-5' exonuclease [Acidobacteriota bacterium]
MSWRGAAGFVPKVLGRRRRELPEPLARQAGLRRRIDPRTPIGEASFVSFDTELTGLDRKRDSIIAIGAVRLRGGRIFPAQSFYSLVRPDGELKSRSVVVHGLTHTDLEHAAPAAKVLPEFVDFIGDSVLVGHFVHIDTGFVGRALRRSWGVKLASPAVDTSTLHDWLTDNDSALARHYGGVAVKKDLFSTAQRYGIPLDRPHAALADAFVTAQLFQRLLHFLPGCGVLTLRDLLSAGKP